MHYCCPLCICNIFYSLFLSLYIHPILMSFDPLATAYCFSSRSVNQTACSARGDTPFLYSRSALLHGMEGPAVSRPKNHNRGSRGDPRGSPDLPRRDLRVSMQIPAVVWRDETEVEADGGRDRGDRHGRAREKMKRR